MFFVLFLVELAFTVSDILTISAAATEDDLYQRLKDCFLMSGRGRRPSLPENLNPRQCSNKILLQLSRLMRADERKTFTDVSSNFRTL